MGVIQNDRELEFAFFYHSNLYQLVREGISDMHCMSDLYLVEDLQEEYKKIKMKSKM